MFSKRLFLSRSRNVTGELGVSERQVRRYLEELVSHKWIEVKRRGLGKTNLYFLLKI
jgi:predicted ArsR family transcriptional regulator